MIMRAGTKWEGFMPPKKKRVQKRLINISYIIISLRSTFSSSYTFNWLRLLKMTKYLQQ